MSTMRRREGWHHQQVAFPLLCPAALELLCRAFANLLFSNPHSTFSEHLPATSLSVSIALVAFACKQTIHDFKPITADDDFEENKRWYQVFLDILICLSVVLFSASIFASSYGQSIRIEDRWNNGDSGFIVLTLLCAGCAAGLMVLMRDARLALKVR